ncbi:ribonuclease H-like domain-containing protein [Tanacetum coccineum]
MTGVSGSNVDSISFLNAGTPLHLQTNDNNSGPLINLKLTGSENYRVWANAMKIALQARNKMCFVDGLDDVHLPIRSALFTQTELPNIKDAFVIVCREESHRGLRSLEIIGYPNSFKRNQNGKNSPNNKGYSSNNVDV